MIFIVLIVAAFLLQLIAPWWIVLILAFVACAAVSKTGKIAFWQSFLAIFILWLGMSLFKSIPNEQILANRVAQMIGVKFGIALILLTALLGGLVAGISGLCGYHFRKGLYQHKN
ncbi:MAG: hypothetical protein EOO99_10605 [Pedobacter sp.]|nr:MAG: hypothetical protein EOO99_10605 [Pedobacter sp.]